MKISRTQSLLLLLILLWLFFPGTIYSQSQNWPMLNYDRERSSWVSEETILYPPLQSTSEFYLRAGGFNISGITYFDGLLCVSTSDNPSNILEAIDVASGDTLWTFQVPGGRGAMGFLCAQTESLVFAGGQHGLGLYALERQTGEILWHKPMDNLFTRNIMLDGEQAFVVADTLYCLDINDGATIWSTFVNSYIPTSPAIDDNYVYVVGKEKMRIYDKFTGELIWEKYNSAEFTGGIAVDDFCFYTFSNDTVFAYDKENRDIEWFYIRAGATIQASSRNTFAVTDEILLFTIHDNGEGKGQVVALDKITGTPMWERSFFGEWAGVGALVVANDVVYVAPGGEGNIYGLKLNTGEALFFDNTAYHTSNFIVADHKLFCTSQKKIFVFENSTIPNTDAQNWPMQNYDRSRSSWVSDETVLYPPLQISAELNTVPGGKGIGGLTYYDGLLCVSNATDSLNRVEAIDVANNDTLWTFRIPESVGGMATFCAQTNSLVFASGQRGLGLYALNRQTGTVKWHKPMKILVGSNVIIDDGNAYVFTDTLYCMDIKWGRTKWKTSIGTSVQGTPAIDYNHVYVVGKEKIRIYDKFTGELIWKKYNGAKFVGGIALDDHCFYTFSNDTVFAYNKDRRDIKWFYQHEGATIQSSDRNTFSVTDEILLFKVRDNGLGNGQIMALTKETGDPVWERTFTGEAVFNSVVANEVVYVVPSGENCIYGYNLNTGEQLFYDKTNYYRPTFIVADHKLFVSTINKILVIENMQTTVVAGNNIVPDRFRLEQNYPNPFNPSTYIKFDIPIDAKVKIIIYDILGREVRTLVDKRFISGSYQEFWDGKNNTNSQVASGVYFVKIKASDFVKVNKMSLLR